MKQVSASTAPAHSTCGLRTVRDLSPARLSHLSKVTDLGPEPRPADLRAPHRLLPAPRCSETDPDVRVCVCTEMPLLLEVDSGVSLPTPLSWGLPTPPPTPSLSAPPPLPASEVHLGPASLPSPVEQKLCPCLVATAHNSHCSQGPAPADHSGLVTRIAHCQENVKQKAFLPATGAGLLRNCTRALFRAEEAR